jgi:hypothetical protein
MIKWSFWLVRVGLLNNYFDGFLIKSNLSPTREGLRQFFLDKNYLSLSKSL